MAQADFDRFIENNRGEMLEFLRNLVACELPSSDAVAGQNAQDLIAEFLSDLGFSVTKDFPVDPDPEDPLHYADRWSVVGLRKGQGNGPSLALNSHADVVGLGDVSKWKYPPRACTLKDGKVYGRGVIDARGCLTTFLFALKAIIESGTKLNGDIIFQSVADEEILGKGTEALVRKGYVADAVLVGEPTKLAFCPATRGAAQFYLDVEGLATHSGVAYEGQNAILKAMRYIEALVQLQEDLDRQYMHPLWQEYPVAHTVNIALINGGESASRVPSACTVSGLVGCIAGESLEDVHRWVEDVVKKVTESDPWLQAHPPVLRWAQTMQFEPSASALGGRFFEIAEACSRDILDSYQAPRAFTAVSDLRYFLDHPGAVGANFGPGDIKQAHAYDESVEFEEIVKACKIAARFIERWTNSDR
ncbi:MAG: ArgE/DapE family deacylase [Eubacteriales bacterium]|nr:ArgE/DapE family deacylase [Eubacteriales bacterium]